MIETKTNRRWPKPVRLPGEKAKCRDCKREFEGGVHAKYCPVCRPLHRENRRTKYVLDGATIALLKDRYDSRVRNRVAEIAIQLNWPNWAVKKAAQKLGLATPALSHRKAWTAKEVAVIEEWAGLRSAAWIARKLGRPESTVILKMKRLAISRRVANGYSVREVAQCFGVDHHVVDRWIERGWIRPSVYGGGHTQGGLVTATMSCGRLSVRIRWIFVWTRSIRFGSSA